MLPNIISFCCFSCYFFFKNWKDCVRITSTAWAVGNPAVTTASSKKGLQGRRVPEQTLPVSTAVLQGTREIHVEKFVTEVSMAKIALKTAFIVMVILATTSMAHAFMAVWRDIWDLTVVQNAHRERTERIVHRIAALSASHTQHPAISNRDTALLVVRKDTQEGDVTLKLWILRPMTCVRKGCMERLVCCSAVPTVPAQRNSVIGKPESALWAVLKATLATCALVRKTGRC
ncbi:hypothetical protein ElyMa_001631700 [Elysia marginata]|uniref:Uncharacterized protein n=1 Tax=Elysia marginata TaxID=1093978 RepID=A0AAV4JL22_9GAST|nr:hypothetical protein ElyMa_001631700 [Elysia marginata]